jgi:hypothetical protein
MSEAHFDPYAVLGVAPDVSDIELRRVYRGLVKRHHPDHNAGSAESARRFAQIQNAYAAIAQRRRGPGATPTVDPASRQQAQTPPSGDPNIESRISFMERELAAAREAEQRRAQQQARLVREQAAKLVAARRAQASQATQSQRLQPTPEELGYYTTDDSFTKIIDDATEQIGERLRKSDAKKQFARRLSDLFGRDD